jgi:hypothetical protein
LFAILLFYYFITQLGVVVRSVALILRIQGGELLYEDQAYLLNFLANIIDRVLRFFHRPSVPVIGYAHVLVVLAIRIEQRLGFVLVSILNACPEERVRASGTEVGFACERDPFIARFFVRILFVDVQCHAVYERPVVLEPFFCTNFAYLLLYGVLLRSQSVVGAIRDVHQSKHEHDCDENREKARHSPI